MRRWGRAGFGASAHVMAELGLEMILLERANEDIEDLQTGIAFMRGAAT